MTSAHRAPGPMPGQRFPHVWGYWVGVLLVLAGIVVAVIGAVNGVTGFADDVNDLRRVLNGNELEASLEAGDEVLVYDEADFGAGPFEVTVIRVSDGAEVSTSAISDGPTYDVDGREGTARVGFRVPTSDIYRVEVDTSVGQVARFAVGADVGNDRANTVVAGLAWGGFLALAGFVAIVVTMVLHARWKVRAAIPGQIDRARSVLEGTARDVVDAPAKAVSAGHEQVTSWTRENIEKAKQSLPSSSAADSAASNLARSIESKGSEWLDAANQVLSGSQLGSAEGATTADLPSDMLDRVGAALDRIEARVAAGDPLREIARDERALVEETVREVAAQTAVTQEQVGDRFAETERAIRDRAVAEVGGAQADLVDLGTIAFDDALAQVTDTGDGLAVGLAATAGAAAAAGAAVVQERTSNLLEPPAPPSDLAPPSPPPPAPVPASTPGLGWEPTVDVSEIQDSWIDPEEPEDAVLEEVSSAKALFGDSGAVEAEVEEISSAKALFDDPAFEDALADEPLFEGSLSEVLLAEEQRSEGVFVEGDGAAADDPDMLVPETPVDSAPAEPPGMVEATGASLVGEPLHEPSLPGRPESILAPPPNAVTAFVASRRSGPGSLGSAEPDEFMALAPPPVEMAGALSSRVPAQPKRSSSFSTAHTEHPVGPRDGSDGYPGDDLVHDRDELPEPLAPEALTPAPPPDYDKLVHT